MSGADAWRGPGGLVTVEPSCVEHVGPWFAVEWRNKTNPAPLTGATPFNHLTRGNY